MNPNLLKGMSCHRRLGEDDFTVSGSGAGPPLETWVHALLSFVGAMEHANNIWSLQALAQMSGPRAVKHLFCLEDS